MPDEVLKEMTRHNSVTGWEDPYTTAEEKVLLRCWFLMDHGISITQGLIKKGVLSPSCDLLGFLNYKDAECRS